MIYSFRKSARTFFYRTASLCLVGLLAVAGCTSKNDVAIQTAYANARTQECVAVANIAQAGAASEAAVLMAARGCGTGPAPKRGADQAAQIIAAVAPIAGAVINGAVGVRQSKVAAETQRENIDAGTALAQIDAGVLTTLGQDQVVNVRPEVVTSTNTEVVTVAPEVVQLPGPIVVQTPGPEVIQLPGPEVIQTPAPQVCVPDADGVLQCS